MLHYTDKDFAHWQRLYNNGWSIRKISDYFNVHRNTIKKYLSARVISAQEPHYTDKDFAHWQRLYNNGWSIRKISDYFNVHKNTIKKYLSARVISAQERNKRFHEQLLDEWNKSRAANPIYVPAPHKRTGCYPPTTTLDYTTPMMGRLPSQL